MCIRLIEEYPICGCHYRTHGVDKCRFAGLGGHEIDERRISNGKACPTHG
ncbi:hypothetical protein BJ508DRAFT_217722 [Ascobolus immersus RN42]|uniref:Uncharacterized protein n=1 Tax=Ascobolus immersus RN42 TaxID=1160509 RepID=A0A3N4HFV9_ASCIM|nr:hypothetical protein BJ508DRAFT_217722 [Ascobolus immersus RN42]